MGPREADETLDVVIAGVGGQGTITAAAVLGRAAVIAGYRVRGMDNRGLAQRGGSVVSHVRIGRDPESPIIPEGAADVLLGFEPSEALRQAHMLRRGGLAIINVKPVTPVAVTIGLSQYPSLDVIKSIITEAGARVLEVDAYGLANKAGAPISLNMVMLGVLAGCVNVLDIRLEHFEAAIRESFRKKAQEANVRALRLGYEEGLRVLNEGLGGGAR